MQTQEEKKRKKTIFDFCLSESMTLEANFCFDFRKELLEKQVALQKIQNKP